MRFLLLLCLLATSCQQSTPPPYAHTELHLSLKSEPTTLDPRKGGDVISSHLQFLLFEGLMRLRADHSITLAQAQSFTCSEDGLTYVFCLKETTWSNGSAVTAYDFEHAWKDILDPSFPSVNAHLLYVLKGAEGAKKGLSPLSAVGVQALDAKTLVITLEHPTPYFLELLTFCVFFPVCQDNPDVYNGPFCLKEWKHRDELIVEKNPLYWDREAHRPDLIHFSIIENEMTALQLFEQGKLDMLGDPISALPVEALADLKQKWPVHTFPMGGITLLCFNVDQVPFNNVKIRKALTYAINRETLVTHVVQTEELPALCAVPPLLKHNTSSAFFQDADVVVAQKLLKEGMKELGITKEDFSHITYLYSQSDRNHKIAQAIQQQWKENLGIEITLENLESKILMDKLARRDYHLAQSLWASQYHDPMSILERFKFKANVKNYPNWENPTYIALLEHSCHATGAEREHLLEQAERLLLSEMPICPLYHWNMHSIVQPHLTVRAGELVFNTVSPKAPRHTQ